MNRRIVNLGAAGLILLLAAGCGQIEKSQAATAATKAVKKWAAKELQSGTRTETVKALEMSETEVYGPFRFSGCRLSDRLSDGSQSATAELWIRGRDRHGVVIKSRYALDAQVIGSSDEMRVGKVKLLEIGPLTDLYKIWSTLWRLAINLFYAVWCPLAFLWWIRWILPDTLIIAAWGLLLVFVAGMVVYNMYWHWYAVPLWFLGLLIAGGTLKATFSTGR